MPTLWSHGIDYNTLCILNKLWLYLRVVTLLDLLSSDGKTFDINVFCGNQNIDHPNPSYYCYCWPKLPPPTKQEKEIWSQYICMAFNTSLVTHSHLTTHEMQWTWESTMYTKWLYSPCQDNMYQKCGRNEWIQWGRVHTVVTSWYATRSKDKPFAMKCWTLDCLEDCIIISVWTHGLYKYKVGTRTNTTLNHNPNPHLPLSQPFLVHGVHNIFTCQW